MNNTMGEYCLFDQTSPEDMSTKIQVSFFQFPFHVNLSDPLSQYTATCEVLTLFKYLKAEKGTCMCPHFRQSLLIEVIIGNIPQG